MIELFSSTRTSPLDLQQRNKISSNNKAENKFQNHLDDSLSQQKSLTEELKQYKLNDQKTELKEINEKISELKESLKNTNQDTKEVNDFIDSLEQIVVFLNNTVQEIEDGNISQDMSLDTWITEMNYFVKEGLTQVSQGDTSSIFHKVSFILEDLDLSSNSMEDSRIAQVNTILQNIVHEFKQIFYVENSDLDNSSSEIKSDQTTQKITLDAEIKSQDTSTTVEISENGDVQLSEEFEITSDVDDSILTETFSGESSFDGDSQESSDQVKILDLRTKNVNNTGAEDSEVFTLESMDAEVKTTNMQSESTISPTIKHNVSIAERTYSSFSSAVSRVQVEALMQNVSGKVSMILQDGGNELRMKLTPPELGQMKLSFLSEDGMMRGKIIVETPEAKMFFEQNINNLRESLANVGVSLGSVDVELGNHQEFSSSETEDQHEGGQAIRLPKASETVHRESSLISPDVIVDFTA